MRTSIFSACAVAGSLIVLACSSSDSSSGGGGGADDAGSEASIPPPGVVPGQPDAGGDAGSDSGGGGATIGAGPYTVLYAGRFAGIDVRPIADGKATFDGIELTGYEFNADERPTLGTNTVSEASSDAFAAIGRWAGGTTGGKFYSAGTGALLDIPANGAFDYAIGIPSSPIPSTGAATYTMTATTAATVSDGSIAPGTASGTLAAVLAGAGNTKIGFSLSLAIAGDATYTIETPGGAAGAATSTLVANDTGMIKSAFLYNGTITSSGGACTGAAQCNAAVYGVVAGANAERIALVAHVYGTGGGSDKSVETAMVFTKQ